MEQQELLKYNIEHVKNSIRGLDKRAGASKQELCQFLGISLATINRNIASGEGLPGYIKGRGLKSRIYFPLINIALFLTESTIK